MGSRSSVAALVVFIGLILAGCASPGISDVSVQSFDFGPPPTESAIKAAVPAYFENVLFDPFTAHYKYNQPYKAYNRKGLLFGGGVEWMGWAVDVEINAKNRMGGYVGWTRYHVLFAADKVTNAFEVGPGPDVLWYQVP